MGPWGHDTETFFPMARWLKVPPGGPGTSYSGLLELSLLDPYDFESAVRVRAHLSSSSFSVQQLGDQILGLG